jgi:hypothetical protein
LIKLHYNLSEKQKIHKMEKDKKTKGKSCTAFYFLAAAIVTTAAVIITIKEGRRIKNENELLSYEVW